MGAVGIAAAATAAASIGGEIAGGSGANTTTTQSGPPAWVQQNIQKAAGLAGDVSRLPLEQYRGQMVAGFSPMQLEAMQGVQNAQGLANPYINTAAQYASSAGQPIGVPGQLTNGQLSSLYGSGLGYSNQAAGTNITGAGRQGINAAYGGAGYGQQAAQQGMAGIGQAVGMGSGANYGKNVQQYMSPYTQDVVNATQAQFNNQNAQQQQGVIGNAVSSGAWGGDRASVAQGITAGQQQLAQAPVIANLYNQGYTNAQSQLNTQQQLGLQGSQAAGQLGLGAGQLASQTGLQAAGLGQSAAQQQAGLQSQAAQQQLQFMQGQQQQGIGAQEASGWLGANTANIYGALGQQAQSGALTDASALYSMGTQQQNLQQEELNIPYEQFQAQQAYPFQVSQYQINALEGLGAGAGGTSSTISPGPSLVSQGIGGALAGAGLYNSLSGGSTLNPVSNIPTYGSIGYSGGDYVPYAGQRGGRVGLADGGRPGIPNGPFGMFAAPMKRSFAADGGSMGLSGIAGLQDTGIEDPSVPYITVTAGNFPHNNIPKPPQPQPQPQANDISQLMDLAKMAGGSFDRGGLVRAGLAAGGGGGATGIPPGGVPIGSMDPVYAAPSKFSGMQAGSRGISHPMLSMPTNSRMPQDNTYNIYGMEHNYTPPSVGAAPYSSTSFPVLHGGSGSPVTTTVRPVTDGSGTWMTPYQLAAQQAAQKSGTGTGTGTGAGAGAGNKSLYSGPINNVTQAYEELLDRKPDAGGLSYWSGMPLQQAIAGIKGSPEYLKDQSGNNGGSGGQGIVGGIDLSGLNIPGLNMSRGGLASPFRSRHDDGGPVGGATPSGVGAPVAGGNPIASGMLQNFRGMSPEKLQELAVRLPPTSAQGQLVRRALQASHANPFSGAPSAARGGRLGLAGGGDAFYDYSPDEADDTGAVAIPDANMTDAIFKHTGLGDVASAKGLSSAPPPAGNSIPPPPAPASHASAAPAAAATTDTEPQGWATKLNSNPWSAMIAAGAGMLASRDPHAGVAIGQGLQAGLAEAKSEEAEEMKRQQADNENIWKNKDIDLRVKDMNQRLDEFKQTHDLATKSEADRVQHEQDMYMNDKAKVGIEAANSGYAAQNAAAHAKEADRGDYHVTRPLLDGDGKPKLDANGLPLAVYTDQYDPSRQRIAPLPDPTIAGGKTAGSTMGLVNKLIDEAKQNGQTLSTIDALAKIHDPSDHYAKTIGMRARDEAFRAAMADPAFQGDPDGTIDRYVAKYGSAPAAAGNTPPAAPGKNLTPITQNGNQYDPETYKYIGPAP